MVWNAGPATLWQGLRGSLWVAVALVPLWFTVYLLNAVAWRMLSPTSSRFSAMLSSNFWASGDP